MSVTGNGTDTVIHGCFTITSIPCFQGFILVTHYFLKNGPGTKTHAMFFFQLFLQFLTKQKHFFFFFLKKGLSRDIKLQWLKEQLRSLMLWTKIKKTVNHFVNAYRSAKGSCRSFSCEFCDARIGTPAFDTAAYVSNSSKGQLSQTT